MTVLFPLWISLTLLTQQTNGLRHIVVNETLWQKEWYLNKGAKNGLDLNVMQAWSQGMDGTGVVVGVVDKGVYNHEDLNLGTTLLYVNHLSKRNTDFSHGIKCAGIIGAKMNGKYAVGIAYNATIADIRMLPSNSLSTDEPDDVKALNAHADRVDIYSCSFVHFGLPHQIFQMTADLRNALETGTKTGRKNKGAIYVFSTGNSGGINPPHSCAYDSFVNNPYTIAVAGIEKDLIKVHSGERCSAILTAAFTSDFVFTNSSDRIITLCGINSTDLSFGYNSAAVPMVAGAAALALQANSNLTYRDMMHLLVKTSRSNLPFVNNDFITNGAGKKVSQTFGFGLLDIGQLVQESLTWDNVPALQECSMKSDCIRKFRGGSALWQSLEDKQCTINSLEHVLLTVEANAPGVGTLKWQLTSPFGTKSTLVPGDPDDPRRSLTITTMSVHFWGEHPVGEWTLRPIEDGYTMVEGRIISWSVHFYGFKNPSVNISPAPLPSQRPTTIMPCEEKKLSSEKQKRTGLVGWQIALIVVGVLLVISISTIAIYGARRYWRKVLDENCKTRNKISTESTKDDVHVQSKP